MNISRLFILRPVATTLLMIAILLAGAVAYKQLPVSALPQVEYPSNISRPVPKLLRPDANSYPTRVRDDSGKNKIRLAFGEKLKLQFVHDWNSSALLNIQMSAPV